MKTIGGIIVAVILIAVVFGVILWSRVPDMLSDKLSDALKVKVNIESVGLGPHDITVKQLVIGNPKGAVLPKAFSCQLIDVNTPILNYFKKDIIIDEIELSDVYLDLEFQSASSTQGNWTSIMSNISSEQNSAQPSTSSRTVLIRKLVIKNIDVDVVYIKEGKKIKKLPRIDQIVLTNISSTGGFPMDQLMNSVLGEMLKSVFIKQNLNNMLQELLNQPSNEFQRYIAPFKGLLNTAPSLMGSLEREGE